MRYLWEMVSATCTTCSRHGDEERKVTSNMEVKVGEASERERSRGRRGRGREKGEEEKRERRREIVRGEKRGTGRERRRGE